MRKDEKQRRIHLSPLLANQRHLHINDITKRHANGAVTGPPLPSIQPLNLSKNIHIDNWIRWILRSKKIYFSARRFFFTCLYQTYRFFLLFRVFSCLLRCRRWRRTVLLGSAQAVHFRTALCIGRTDVIDLPQNVFNEVLLTDRSCVTPRTVLALLTSRVKYELGTGIFLPLWVAAEFQLHIIKHYRHEENQPNIFFESENTIFSKLRVSKLYGNVISQGADRPSMH